MFAPPQISIRKAAADDVDALETLNNAMGHGKAENYFSECLDRQENESLSVYIASVDHQDIAYGLINWLPKYKYYQANKIPEIQDLNVLQTFRRQGVATQMIHFCEDIVKKRGHKHIGISVGLTADYGPAQRIYSKMGYIPDGHGVAYDRESIKNGEFRPIDDNLCLMMVKDLA